MVKGVGKVQDSGVAAPDCIFCRIFAGEVEASVVHEDERTITFMDILRAGWRS
jgi:hypothetical protein